MRIRIAIAAVALVIGVASLLAGSWLSSVAMALVIAGQGFAEWDSRRRATRARDGERAAHDPLRDAG
jgi:hypothetical protein